MNLKISKENKYYYIAIMAILLALLALKGGELLGAWYYHFTH